MVEFIGILKVKVIRGTKLAVRDLMSSDPYVVLMLGQQVLQFQVQMFLVYGFAGSNELFCFVGTRDGRWS
jgi:hypothetical protein